MTLPRWGFSSKLDQGNLFMFFKKIQQLVQVVHLRFWRPKYLPKSKGLVKDFELLTISFNFLILQNSNINPTLGCTDSTSWLNQISRSIILIFGILAQYSPTNLSKNGFVKLFTWNYELQFFLSINFRFIVWNLLPKYIFVQNSM